MLHALTRHSRHMHQVQQASWKLTRRLDHLWPNDFSFACGMQCGDTYNQTHKWTISRQLIKVVQEETRAYTHAVLGDMHSCSIVQNVYLQSKDHQ